MSLGEPAGRSSKNPSRPTARRRMSEQERSLVRPMKDDPIQWPDSYEEAASRWMYWILFILWGINCVLFLIFPGFWTGALLFVLGLCLALATDNAVWRSEHSKGRRR